LFKNKHITLKGAKSFLGYPSTTLLGQRVDGFGLSTTAEKLAAISALEFPRTLKDLETYLGLTGWMRNYIPYYAQICESLQQRKTTMLKASPRKGKPRRSYSKKVIINEPTEKEEKAFKTLQELFSKPTFLVHFNPRRQLYVDLDASKRYGFSAMVYYIEGDSKKGTVFKREGI